MSVYIPVALRQAIRQQFKERCAYCQTPEHLTVAIFEIEHIMPRSVGGETLLANLCLSCPTCNRYKASRQTAVDPQSDQQVALFHPQQDQWNLHFAWSSDGLTLTGKTAVGRATIPTLRINRPQLTRLRRMWIKLDEHPPK